MSDKIREQLAKELKTEIEHIRVYHIGDSIVDFYHIGTDMWAKLTKTGNVKKNSIRRNLY